MASASYEKHITLGLNAYNATAKISAANWENSLVEPVTVDEGDAIYVKSSFIDARLHTSANILIEQDTTIKIEVMFYYINRGGNPVKSLYPQNVSPDDPYQTANLVQQVGVGEFGTLPDTSPDDADFAPIIGYPPGYDPAWAPLPPSDPNADPKILYTSGLPLNISDEKNILNMAPIVETIICPEIDGLGNYLNPENGTSRLPVNCGDGMPYLLYRTFPSNSDPNGTIQINIDASYTNAIQTGLQGAVIQYYPSNGTGTSFYTYTITPSGTGQCATGTTVIIPGAALPLGITPTNNLFITYTGPPFTPGVSPNPPETSWAFSGNPPLIPYNATTSNQTMTNNDVQPFVKEFKYTIPKGSYSPDTLGVMISRAMSIQKQRVLRKFKMGGENTDRSATSYDVNDDPTYLPALPEIEIDCLTIPCQLPSSMMYGDQRSTWNSGFGATDTNQYIPNDTHLTPFAPINITPTNVGPLTFTPTLNDWIFNPVMNKPLYDIQGQQCGWNSLNYYDAQNQNSQFPTADINNGLNVFMKPYYDNYSNFPSNNGDFGTGDMFNIQGTAQGGPAPPTDDTSLYQSYSFASKNKQTQPIGTGKPPPVVPEPQPLGTNYNGEEFIDYDDTPFLFRPTAFQTVQQRFIASQTQIAQNQVPPRNNVVPDEEQGDSLYILRPPGEEVGNAPLCPRFQPQTTLGGQVLAVTNVPVYRLCANYAHNTANGMKDIDYNLPSVPTRRPATVEVFYKPFLTDVRSNYFQSRFLVKDGGIVDDYFIKPILSTQALPLNTDLGDTGTEVNGPNDITSPVVGAQQIALIWNPDDNIFQFTYTHTPLYNKPDLASSGQVEVVGVYPCNVFVNNNYDPQNPAGVVRGPYPAPYFRTVRGTFQATRQSGVIFKSMTSTYPDGSPAGFWEKIGFNVAELTASPPDNNPSAPFVSWNRFNKITTGGFIGTGSIMNPETKACGLNEPAYITYQDSLNLAGWWTRDRKFTPYDIATFGPAAKQQFQQTFTLVSDPMYYEVQSTNYLTANTVPLDNTEAGHYLIEIQGYSTTHIDEQQKSEIKSIVSSYFISANSFVSNALPENFRYYHYGPSMKISCLKIRILNPITKQEVLLLGGNSTVYLSIEKSSPTVPEGKKTPETINALPVNWNE
jgi:hypothetical protein